MYPEDRVLVAVINRKRDLVYARDEHWYRIPQARMPRGVNVEYLAFFLSGAFGARNGGICYYAERRGLELVYRRDVLPREAAHPRAGEVYYRVGLGALVEKQPPVLNPTRRPISFIDTTWDRFAAAQTVSDLYSEDDAFVERADLMPRSRSAGGRESAGLRVYCLDGTLTALPDRWSDDVAFARSSEGC